MKLRLGVALALGLLLAAGSPSRGDDFDLTMLGWQVVSLVDESRNPYGDTSPPDQTEGPRDARGLGISPDGRYLYVGYNGSFTRNAAGGLIDRQGEVRVVDLTVGANNFFGTDNKFENQLGNRVLGNRGKAITVDNRGLVYLADAGRIDIYSADLSTLHFTINAGLGVEAGTEGISYWRNPGTGQLYLYAASRSTGRLSRFTLTESTTGGGDPTITGAALDLTFDVDGRTQVTLTGTAPDGATDRLRNIEVNPDGSIWVAAFRTDRIYRVTVAPDGTASQTFADVDLPFDIGFNGNQVLITHHVFSEFSFVPLAPTDIRLTGFHQSDFFANTIGANGYLFEPDWAGLLLDDDQGNQETFFKGATSGIVVRPGFGFWVANENGQTEADSGPGNPHVSEYGMVDTHSDFVNGTFYTDALDDDNEPILFAFVNVIPEPGAMILGAIALAALIGYARRARR